MKVKKVLGLSVLMASLMLAACNGGNKSSEASKQPSSSQPSQSQPASSQSQSSGNQQQSSSQQGSQTSQSQSSQSSQQGGDQSSSQQGGDQSSQQGNEKTVNVTAMTLEKKTDNKVYLKVAGTQANHTAAEFKWAWGLATVASEPQFVYGSATPEASAFASASFDANNAFNVELCLSDIQALTATAFTIYGGTPDTYKALTPVDEASTARDGNFKYYFRADTEVSGVVLAELPVVALEEATVYKPTGSQLPEGKTAGIYAKIGGTVKAGTDVSTLKVKADFQRVEPSYSKHPQGGWGQNPDFPAEEQFWTIDGDKAYINLYIGFMQGGEAWMTHLGFNTNDNPNCFMANDINNVKYTFADDGLEITVNAKESEGQAGRFYGCLGFALETIA